ncbi:Na+/H+ antiporter NhaA [Pseudonocardia kunmingensis]|uniref:Na(+)/H(+) antiporter NhaA n=1 Tax=Pseudonocardia kunmingensis TaxID=630975 RepID=A0A543DAT9_9PSEU|nr:Na+/H+ antiporter NhaA [Pseudonocardia kunmingensis]TQM06398.1 sodium/proton antiporter (NhaA family) [Pseudonocardia kunmingensis]
MHDRRPATPISEFARYLRTETVGGVVLVVATAIALLWANSPWAPFYQAMRDTVVGPAALHLDLTLAHWATDGLLALFFFVVGLELKRELVIGELSTRSQALLPVAAALGGMIVPALLALVISYGSPGAGQAWAIPVATDIAFALGVLALAGSAMPVTARVFLLGLAVADDLGAIVVIAVLFSSGVQVLWLGAVALAAALYWWLQRRRVRAWWIYVPLGLFTWFAMHEAGVHATISGVLLGLLTRVRPDPDEEFAPALRLEHRLQPWSAGLCVPVFALFAAGVPIGPEALRSVVTEPVALGVIVGLLAGKIIGIFGACWMVVKLTPASRPRGLSWRDLAAVSMLGGVGFTVSLLIAELSLAEHPGLLETAKAAVLVASAAASLIGAAMLVRRGRARARENGDAEGGPAPAS